jgi:hypothetical protein
MRLSALEGQMMQRNHEIAALQSKLSQDWRVQEGAEQEVRAEVENANRRANEA